MISLLFYIVFFLFSSTKIGHGRPSVKNRYAISDKNILRSYVVRYFYLKFLVCRSSMPLERQMKKGKKCVPVQCGADKSMYQSQAQNGVGGAWRRLCLRPIPAETVVLDYFVQLQLLAPKLADCPFERFTSRCTAVLFFHPALVATADTNTCM